NFMHLLNNIDVYLDSIGWNGGITSMRALALNCPIVTMPTEFMRGRHSCAMLEMIGCDELIVNSVDDYVELAARLGNDNDYLQAQRKAIEERKDKLFYDKTCIEYLDRFFKTEIGLR
ncbi:MAG: glycosyltransferase, partial [Cyanobacteria bacterium]|nr:glycosyltransferase [Cyanobacteriota bacterium]